jgi:hypothetical protein
MLLAEEGSLIEMVLMLGTAVVALVSGATGALVAYNNPELVTGVPYPITSTMITCTIVGHGIAHVRSVPPSPPHTLASPLAGLTVGIVPSSSLSIRHLSEDHVRRRLRGQCYGVHQLH